MKKTFLVELGTEELPPKTLRLLGESFASNFQKQVSQVQLSYGKVFWYASPRRLALKVSDLSSCQPDLKVHKRGPAISQAFDITGKPTKIANAWAKRCGINIEQAELLATDKGAWLLYRVINKGCSAQSLLVDIVSKALMKLPIQKLMRWGDKDTEFVRPVHTVVMLFGDELIEGEILGVQSSRVIRGHRFMGDPELIIDSAEQYPAILYQRGKVIADYLKRKDFIKSQINKIAKQLDGIVELSDNFLEEVTSLVEWPVVLSAKFEEKFLSIPVEPLVYTMKHDQKYFPVYNLVGNLMANFIFVANIVSSSPEEIIAGNEKVIRSRLSDAEFFFKTDRKKRLEEYLPQLETVLFQKQLGTLRDKTERLKVLASWIAGKIGANINHTIRASLLSKCDLMTNMVFEFTDTQGIMGMHYARLDGEAEDVAIAIKEQYQPRFSGDKLPINSVGVALSLADKMDTLVGIFGINNPPKGDKDPFGLRRAAIGVLRIIIENGYDLDLIELVKKTSQLYTNKLINKNVINNVVTFMIERFPTWYQKEGYRIDIVQAVLACKPTRPTDFNARVKAVSNFLTLPEAETLVIDNKRIANILDKSLEKVNSKIISSALKVSEEIKLATHLVILEKKLTPLFANGEYQHALIELAALHESINALFDKVMIMDSDRMVRINRLTLLSKLRNLFLQVADISLLQ